MLIRLKIGFAIPAYATAFLACGSAFAQDAATPAPPAVPTTTVLEAQTPIAVGASGHFDYMTVDSENNRIFASHPGTKGLVVVDLTNKSAREIDLGAEVNGVAVDRKDGIFFTGGGGQKVFALDLKTLEQKSELDLAGPGDGIYFDSDNDMLYVDNDEDTHVWVVDPKTTKIVSTISIDKAPESMAYDRGAKRLFQNIKSADEIQVIDTTTNTVTATWPTTPAKSPHGLVFDRRSNRLYVAGKNDILVTIDATSGKVLGSTPLATGTDQIAYDRSSHRIYCPGGGALTIVTLDDSGNASTLGQIAIDKGAHTIAVDPKTHDVWICYPGSDGKSYVQAYTAQKSVAGTK